MTTPNRQTADTADRVTLILHTRDRPEFVRRTLAHCARHDDFRSLNIDVVDGSSDGLWPDVEKACSNHPLPHLTVHHSSAEVPFRTRLAQALDRCRTPYLMLAADDDFYLPDWLDQAAEVLDREPSIGTVHGHVLFFSLPSYVQYGPVERFFIHPRAVPPLSWLEAECAADRVRSISDGTHEPSVPGWYALQRTGQLKALIAHAERIGLPDEFYEYWMVCYQALLGKTHMLDRIILARQEDDKAIRPSPTVWDSAEWLAIMRVELVELLQSRDAISRAEAEEVVSRYLRGVESELRRLGDQSALLRIRAHPVTRFIAQHLLRRPARASDCMATAYPDARLPPIPAVDGQHPAVRIVREATRPAA